MGEDAKRDTRRRLAVAEAADVLGVTVDAIRSRVKRGTIAHVREGGRVYVLLGADRGRPGHDQPTDRLQSDSGALTSELRDRLRYVEGQLSEERQAHAEARRIIAGLVERIPPAIEAPRESPETVEEPSEGAQPHPGTEGSQGGVQRPQGGALRSLGSLRRRLLGW